jgi:predicted MFS family arabinose efflux permease
MATGALIPKLTGTVTGFVGGVLLTAVLVFVMLKTNLVATEQARVVILVAYGVGTMAGGAIAGAISKGSRGAIVFCGALLLMVGALNLTMTSHPEWFKLWTPIVFVLGTFAALKISTRRPVGTNT